MCNVAVQIENIRNKSDLENVFHFDRFHDTVCFLVHVAKRDVVVYDKKQRETITDS